ncbi:MAG TPA: hypothetical protein VEW45_07670 [Candidatus Dormibacteraeota bacterium]|nr:hypothetical protein [Candidatus Dormibacteraeota bacterium]
MRDRLLGATRPDPLPTLYERHPNAAAAVRRARGLQVVPLDRIVGTVRQPTQNTSDFLPLPVLRGRNWEARWQRILKAVDNLAMLPAIDVVQVGDEYYVVDGHNRVAAALRVGAAAIDADVTELVLPGSKSVEAEHTPDAHTLLLGADEVREAVAGRQSRTAERRSRVDELRREELAGDDPGVQGEAGEPPDR